MNYHDKYTNYLYYMKNHPHQNIIILIKNKYEFIFNENQKKPIYKLFY